MPTASRPARPVGTTSSQPTAQVAYLLAAALLLGKDGERQGLALFKSAGLVTPGNEAQIKAKLAASFKGNEGVTLRHVGVVATTGFSSFPGRESFNENLITNLTVHEGGHAVSRRSPDWDHTTGGVMAKSIDPFDMPLHYTATFLQQFVREKAKKKARTKKR